MIVAKGRCAPSLSMRVFLSHIHCFGFFHRYGDAVHCKVVDSHSISYTLTDGTVVPNVLESVDL